MRQRYDNVAKFVTTEYAEPFVELILKYPNATVLENLATEQITLKARETDSTLKVQFPDEVAILHNEVQAYNSQEPILPEGIMQESPFFREYIQEAEERAMERGLERGQKKCAIGLILELLSEQFQSESIQTLKPDLERIDDLDRLKQLLRAVPKTPSLEAFTKAVREI